MADYVITMSDSTRNEGNEVVSAIDGLSNDLEIKIVTSKGFSGIGEIMLLISALGGGVLAKQLASVLVAWMKSHERRRVRIGKLEVTGYSVAEVERILKAADK